MCLNSDFAAENSSSTCSMCESIEPPMSKNTSTLTALRRSGRITNVEIAVVGGFLDRGVEIELVGRAGAGEFAQSAQRDLDVADTELDIAVEVLELAL